MKTSCVRVSVFHLLNELHGKGEPKKFRTYLFGIGKHVEFHIYCKDYLCVRISVYVEGKRDRWSLIIESSNGKTLIWRI